MIRFRIPAVSGGLFLAALLASACSPDPPGPAVVNATILDDGQPVPGAIVKLRLLNDSAATAVTDPAGRVRVELAGAEGPGMLEIARDTTQPRPSRVYTPLLLAPGDSANVVLAVDEDRGRQARFLGDTRMARWGRAAQASLAIEHDHYAAYREWVAAGQEGELTPDYRGSVDSVRSWLAAENDPEVRSALWVARLIAGARGETLTAGDGARGLEETAPDAAIWTWRPRDVPTLARVAAAAAEGTGQSDDSAGGQDVAGRRELAVRRADAYVDRVIDAHEGSGVHDQMLFAAVQYAARTNRMEAAREYFQRLETAHPESPWTARAEERLPDPDLQVGRPAPDVPLPALDSTEPPIAPAELAGPATLVDFWAAWCTPCVAEMPVIHEAYERFAGRGFDVVSISFDASRDDVARFRETYPMPWRHSFVGAENFSDGAVVGAWGVNGLPAAFLIGPDGTILALEGELRGERLMQTLERVLGG